MKTKDPRTGTVLLFGGTLALSVILLVPLAPCPEANCASVYQTRMQYARLPGLTPEQADSIRRYAVADSCSRCSGFRRISLGSILIDLFSLNSQRAS